MLPDRLSDFTRYYEKPKSRKSITFESYTIEDYLQGVNVTKIDGARVSKVVGPTRQSLASRQQLALVKSIKERFRSSLFDIRQLAKLIYLILS